MAGPQPPETISTKQMRIATMARQKRGVAIRSLNHHLDLEWLQEAVHRTRKDGAAGVDGQTSAEYATSLDLNLLSLLDRAKTGTYRAPPVRRVHIPKGDGRKTRPLGIPTYEDKVLQRAVVMLLEPIYEEEFYDFSYGFRPGRSAHDALEAVNQALWGQGGGWVLDADIKSFFDTLDHGQLRELLRLRVVDGVVVRLIGKWLQAGVLDGGIVQRSSLGTPQGGVISPLLANIYLHEVLDRWWVEEVLPRLSGRARLVRYADDFVVVFSNLQDAQRVQAVLPKRFARFGLTLHPEKTRLVRVGPPRSEDPDAGSFDFLGFTHYYGMTRKKAWAPKRKTAKGRFARGLKNLNEWMRRHRHMPVAEQARLLSAKLRGHFQYYGIRGNSEALSRFRHEARRLWHKWLSRRSQKAYLDWEKFQRLEKRHPLPPARLPSAAWRTRPARP